MRILRYEKEKGLVSRVKGFPMGLAGVGDQGSGGPDRGEDGGD